MTDSKVKDLFNKLKVLKYRWSSSVIFQIQKSIENERGNSINRPITVLTNKNTKRCLIYQGIEDNVIHFYILSVGKKNLTLSSMGEDWIRRLSSRMVVGCKMG